MEKNSYIIKILIVYLFLSSVLMAKQSDYFKEGMSLFQKKQYDKSKILFEKDIVFNPKSEKSYLYLAKIFNENENDEEQEINLNNVLLLNPLNEEALYMLTLLKIKQSDYKQVKELIDKFNLVYQSFCSKNAEIEKKFEKLTLENAKNNN